MGPEDVQLLVRSFPRLFLKDLQRNLLPKAQQLAAAYPPLTLRTLLRDHPQLFFYSTPSLEAKLARMQAALPSLNVTAMMTRFPSIACMDVDKNIVLKVSVDAHGVFATHVRLLTVLSPGGLLGQPVERRGDGSHHGNGAGGTEAPDSWLRALLQDRLCGEGKSR
jgi:hypothetical protein